MRGTLEVALKANLDPRRQHCTDEAQRAETILQLVIYIYIYMYIYIYLTGFRKRYLPMLGQLL